MGDWMLLCLKGCGRGSCHAGGPEVPAFPLPLPAELWATKLLKMLTGHNLILFDCVSTVVITHKGRMCVRCKFIV